MLDAEYWDSVADEAFSRSIGNPWRSSEITRRVLAYDHIGKSVLEIGVGMGSVASGVRSATMGTTKIVCTDLSSKFCEFVSGQGFEACQTDIKNLPEGPFDFVWAFDTLEHVRPEDRACGYQQINKVLGRRGTILLHLPLSESHHDEGHDFGIGIGDVSELANATGTSITKWDAYAIPRIGRGYAFVALQK